MDRGERQREDSDDTNYRIDWEEHFPSQAHIRNSRRSTPHRDIRREERGDRLDELTKGQRRGEVARYDVRY